MRRRSLLLLDNYDSFTYNLLQYLTELGADVTVVRNDAITVEEAERGGHDGIVISPGPCTPREAGISVDLIRRLSGRRPILGVCLGHQAIASAFGGTIMRAPEIMHGKTSEIEHDGRGVYLNLPNPFIATRYHSLCIDPRSVPRELVVTSRVRGSEEEIIMGVRHEVHPTEGVQFHPESILTEYGKSILQNFLDKL